MLDFKLSMDDFADNSETYDLIIIGGGPAGLTAGLYAARYKLKTLMIEKAAATGGQLIATQWVENYPGFPEPVLGQKLAQDMESQARLFGLQIVKEDVTSVDLGSPIKTVTTTYNTWKARTILIATGSSPRKLEIPQEDEYSGNGVSYCATCDGPFYPDKVVAVVGGGNTAFEEALFIAKYARKIYLIHRRERYTADPILQERVGIEPKIELITNTTVKALSFDHDPRKLILSNLKTNTESDLPVDGIFIFIGAIPNTSLFTGQLEMEEGYLLTDRELRTSQPGVWAAGDVQAKTLRQVATAVGDGALAAHGIHQYLLHKS